MYREQRVIVIAPCLNEESKIGTVVQRIKKMKQSVVDEILVVDDGSNDGSVEKATEQGASVLALDHTHGVGAALRQAFKYSIDKGFDIIVVIAGNNKDEPNEIPDLLAPLIEGKCDFVQGSRFLRSQDFGDMPNYRRIATRLHALVFSLCVGRRVTESTNGFRAFKIHLLRDTRIKLDQRWLDQYELEPYLYHKVIKLGYRTTEIPCTKTYPPKKIGYTKMKPVVGWWSILRPMILLRLGLRS